MGKFPPLVKCAQSRPLSLLFLRINTLTLGFFAKGAGLWYRLPLRMPHRRRRILRHCQVVLTTTAVLVVAGLILGLWWVNRNGFAGQWGEKFSAELERRGIHAEFQSVRFSPLRGLLAKNVIIYHSNSRQRIFAEIPSLQLDIDRAEAMRGELVLRKLILSEARLNIPLPTDGEAPRELTLEELSAKITLDRQGRLLLDGGSGKIGGLEFSLQAELDQFRSATLLETKSPEAKTGSGAFLDTIFAEVENWQFPEAASPHLDLQFQGSLLKPSSIRTSFSLAASTLTRHHYTMASVLLAGELHGRNLVVDQFEFFEGPGRLVARLDYDLIRLAGRYEVDSSIHLSRLLRNGFNRNTLDQFTSVEAPEITAYGDFTRRQDGSIDTVAMGRLRVPTFLFQGSKFESLKTEFSWKDGNMFLRDLSVHDTQGSLEGTVLIKDDDIRFKATSTLAIKSYTPFLEDASGLARTISRASFDENSSLLIESSGWIQRSQLKNWSATGRAKLENLTFNEVALKSASADFTINPQGSSFKEIEILFDYRDYPFFKKHGGAAEALVKAKEISFDRQTLLTKIDHMQGTAWPGPLLRLFTPKTAHYIERTFRNRKPPLFSASGIVDRGKERARTEVKVQVQIPGLTDYTFLGKELHLAKPSFLVRVRPKRVDLTDFSFSTFRGTAGGELTVFIPKGAPPHFRGGLRWTRLHLAEIGKTYGFEKATQGLVTGRFDFSGTTNSVRTLNGNGSIGLENGHLFYVPVFGPLSAPLGEILGNKRASHEEARNASCAFAVTKGVFQTRDFLTSTPNSVFTGEGDIDLEHKTIDMTIRMNARGLLGLITLPLRPFYGLFQFRGTGALKSPTWRNSSFTPPSKGKSDPIFRKPGKAQIVPDP